VLDQILRGPLIPITFGVNPRLSGAHTGKRLGVCMLDGIKCRVHPF
jgi:hypothetical protein